MAKKIIGGIILAILIGYAAYYGTQVLSANQEQKDINTAALVMSVGTSTSSATTTSATLPADACTSLRSIVAKYNADIASTTAFINQNTAQLNTKQANLETYNKEMIELDKKANKLIYEIDHAPSSMTSQAYSALNQKWSNFLSQEYYPVVNKINAAKKDIDGRKRSIDYNKNLLQGFNNNLSKYQPKLNICLKDNNLAK